MSVHRRTTVSESVARPARTAIQATPAFIITQLIDSFYNLSDTQFGLVVLILTAVISFVQTKLEDHTGKAILRNVPSKETPVVDQ